MNGKRQNIVRSQRKLHKKVTVLEININIVNDEWIELEPLVLKLYASSSIYSQIGLQETLIGNAILSIANRDNFEGWIPVYDSLSGIQAEIRLTLKFTFIDKSIKAIPFEKKLPTGYGVSILGFVEELICESDPEFEWTDNFRSPRTSNDARVLTVARLNAKLMSQIRLKSMALGAEFILGAQQYIDFEGDSGIVARFIGTACRKNDDNRFKLMPAVKSDVIFLTFNEIPIGAQLRGMVSARSVKFLGKLTSKREDVEIRDEWWQELRNEIRTQVKNLNCAACIGYSEKATIFEDVCTLTATGTAIRLSKEFSKFKLLYPNEKINIWLYERILQNGSKKLRKPCSSIHIAPSSNRSQLRLSPCGLCKGKFVAEITLSTSKLPYGLPICNEGSFIFVSVSKTREKTKARTDGRENDAVRISDQLVFAEIELYKKLVFRLKAKGLNCVFGVKTELTVTPTRLYLCLYGTAYVCPAIPLLPSKKDASMLIDKSKVDTARFSKALIKIEQVKMFKKKYKEQLKRAYTTIFNEDICDNKPCVRERRASTANLEESETTKTQKSQPNKFMTKKLFNLPKNSNPHKPVGNDEVNAESNRFDRSANKQQVISEKRFWKPWKKNLDYKSKTNSSDNIYSLADSFPNNSNDHLSSSSSSSSSSSESSLTVSSEDNELTIRNEQNSDNFAQGCVIEIEEDLWEINDQKVIEILTGLSCRTFSKDLEIQADNLNCDKSSHLVRSFKFDCSQKDDLQNKVIEFINNEFGFQVPCVVHELNVQVIFLAPLILEVIVSGNIFLVDKSALHKTKTNTTLKVDSIKSNRVQRLLEIYPSSRGTAKVEYFCQVFIREKLGLLADQSIAVKDNMLQNFIHEVKKLVKGSILHGKQITELSFKLPIAAATRHSTYYIIYVTGLICKK